MTAIPWVSPFVAALLVLAGLPSQQFVAHESPVGPTDLVTPPVDLDGDGDADLITSSANATRVLWNDGHNRFRTSTPIAPYWLSNRGAFGDFDRDGDLDYLTFASATSLALVTNRGGSFTVAPVTVPPFLMSSTGWALTPVDFDGDGDLDVLRHEYVYAPHLALLQNLGSGQFADVSAQWLPSGWFGWQFPADRGKVLDVDLDGRQDLLLWGAYAPILLRNTGTRFVHDSARLPSVAQSSVIDVDVADLDGDGDHDLVIASYRLAVVENRGGRLVDVTRDRLSPPHSSGLPRDVVLVDADGDGDPDLHVHEGTYTWPYGNPIARLWRNDGAGRFTVMGTSAPFRIALQRRTTAVDLEGDSDEDLVRCDQGIGLLRNAGGTFEDALQNEKWLYLAVPLALDADGDGDQDVRTVGALARNDGTGRFAVETRPLLFLDVLAVRTGDLDGDGDADLVDRNRVLRNDGTGAFVPLRSGPVLGGVNTVGDYDADGDLDIATTTSGVTLHRNHGNASFAPPVTIATGFHGALDSGDFDGDGDADLLASSGPLAARLLLQQGNGTFASQPLPFAQRARFAKFRRQGAMDLVCDEGVFRVWRLQGGTFVDVTASTLPAGFTATAYVLADLDGDGAADLLASQLLRNDGTGRLVPEPSGVPFTGFALADLDGDLDLDLLDHWSSPDDRYGKIAWNREHHVWLPLPPHVGRNLRLDVTAHPGRAGPFETALLGIAWQRLPTGIRGPLGTLHLGALAAMLPVAIPAGAGLAEVDLPIPSAPALVGTPMFFQALHVSPTGLGLSNCASTRIE